MKTILSILVLGLCCIVFDAPLGVSLAILGLAMVSGSYKATKSGALDGRAKLKVGLFLLGAALIIVGCILTTATA